MKPDTFYVEARYIGSDSSSPFNRKQTYILRVKQSTLHRIYIVPVHGHEVKPLVDMAWTYRSLKDFLTEWKVENTYHPDGERNSEE